MAYLATPGSNVPGSQPTYKEWKLFLDAIDTAGDTVFPAYLQGMETSFLESAAHFGAQFPAYLQGMETFDRLVRPDLEPGSQPTYKEWKRLSV